MPTPIKYFNPAIAEEYKKIELAAEQKLLSMLPEEFHDDYAPLVDSEQINQEDYAIVKQADSLCAYLKCLEELNVGNHEFAKAKANIEHNLQKRSTPEMEYFLATFVDSFNLTLDEIS